MKASRVLAVLLCARLFGSASAVALGNMMRMTRVGVWLAILVAAGCSSAFAQRGVQEFTSTATFQVPAGVSALWVDAYGAGGGGGGATSCFHGGGRGGGAYAAGGVTGSPRAVLSLLVGGRGQGGVGGQVGGAVAPC